MRIAAVLALFLFFISPFSISAAQEENVSFQDPERRDPFRDLLAKGDSKKKPVVTDISQMFIDDVTIAGIVKLRGKFMAIINGPQGMPFSIKEGDKLADGFVLSIDLSEVILRKTVERGFLLKQPKDIVKEITPGER